MRCRCSLLNQAGQFGEAMAGNDLPVGVNPVSGAVVRAFAFSQPKLFCDFVSFFKCSDCVHVDCRVCVVVKVIIGH